MNKTFAIFALTLFALTTTVCASADEYYRWVDDDGVVHFTAQPPKNRPSLKVKTSTGRKKRKSSEEQVAAAPPGASTKAPADAAPTGPAEDDDYDPERCDQARKNIEILSSYARVRQRAEDGSMTYLSEEQKQTKMKEAQQAAKESCKKTKK